MTRLWRKIMDGCKYLVVRRDGTVPKWPHFVLGARDPAAPAALREYARTGRELGYDAQMMDDMDALADEFDAYRAEHGAGDPDAAPDRPESAGVVLLMTGGGFLSGHVTPFDITAPKRRTIIRPEGHEVANLP